MSGSPAPPAGAIAAFVTLMLQKSNERDEAELGRGKWPQRGPEAIPPLEARVMSDPVLDADAHVSESTVLADNRRRLYGF